MAFGIYKPTEPRCDGQRDARRVTTPLARRRAEMRLAPAFARPLYHYQTELNRPARVVRGLPWRSLQLHHPGPRKRRGRARRMERSLQRISSYRDLDGAQPLSPEEKATSAVQVRS